MFKRLISSVLLLALVLTLAVPAFADPILDPNLPGGCSLTASVSFKNGNAVASAKATSRGLTMKVKVTLQRKAGHNWVNVSSKTGTKDASVSATATKGCYYRVTASCSYYDSNGTYIGSANVTSSSKKY